MSFPIGVYSSARKLIKYRARLAKIKQKQAMAIGKRGKALGRKFFSHCFQGVLTNLQDMATFESLGRCFSFPPSKQHIPPICLWSVLYLFVRLALERGLRFPRDGK